MENRNRNRNIWIIVAIVVVVLCCLLAALAAAVVLGLGWFGARVSEGGFSPGFSFDQIIEHREMSFEVGAAPALQIDNFAGDVTIRTGREGVISVDASLRAGQSENLRSISIEPSQEGDTVRIRTRRPSAQISNISVGLDITVPPGTRIDVSNGAGEVSIDGIAADIAAQTGAGDVEVRNSQGQARLSTGAGDIDYAGQPAGSSTFRTGVGTVRIALPSNFAGSVDLDTGIGSVKLGGFDVAGSVSSTAARGTIGGGGDTTIEAHTGAGDIDLVRR
jgi:hypothetical protein